VQTDPTGNQNGLIARSPLVAGVWLVDDGRRGLNGVRGGAPDRFGTWRPGAAGGRQPPWAPWNQPSRLADMAGSASGEDDVTIAPVVGADDARRFTDSGIELAVVY
jgi:hypothetical protein